MVEKRNTRRKIYRNLSISKLKDNDSWQIFFCSFLPISYYFLFFLFFSQLFDCYFSYKLMQLTQCRSMDVVQVLCIPQSNLFIPYNKILQLHTFASLLRICRFTAVSTVCQIGGLSLFLLLLFSQASHCSSLYGTTWAECLWSDEQFGFTFPTVLWCSPLSSILIEIVHIVILFIKLLYCRSDKNQNNSK